MLFREGEAFLLDEDEKRALVEEMIDMLFLILAARASSVGSVRDICR